MGLPVTTLVRPVTAGWARTPAATRDWTAAASSTRAPSAAREAGRDVRSASSWCRSAREFRGRARHRSTTTANRPVADRGSATSRPSRLEIRRGDRGPVPAAGSTAGSALSETVTFPDRQADDADARARMSTAATNTGVHLRSAPTRSLPINCVSWDAALAFCAWDVPGGRLPTDVEREYVARWWNATPAETAGPALPVGQRARLRHLRATRTSSGCSATHAAPSPWRPASRRRPVPERPRGQRRGVDGRRLSGRATTSPRPCAPRAGARGRGRRRCAVRRRSTTATPSAAARGATTPAPSWLRTSARGAVNRFSTRPADGFRCARSAPAAVP